MLPASERQLWVEQHAIGGQGMKHGLGNETMSGGDAICPAVGALNGRDFGHVLGWI
jgi:hypothetical protein